MALNTIIRMGKFDAGHRVMHERFKCFNLHGHEYHYRLQFSYSDSLDLGYAIDFKELKRIGCQFIDDHFDHAFICNPADTSVLKCVQETSSKNWVMNLHPGFCNPSAENIAKELFYCISFLLNDTNLRLEKLTLHETVNCYVECMGLSDKELQFLSVLDSMLLKYKIDKGTIDYDERSTTP